MLQSEQMRRISAESDCLHYGMGWSTDDLGKPNIMIQSSYGESHPGSSHLLGLAGCARDGVMEAGARPCMFVVSDMCDGVAQGSRGGNYSLLSRDFIADMIEIQARSTLCDGLVLLASCDKSMPAHIIAAARLSIPAVIMPGGCMSAGSSFCGCDQMWEARRKVEEGTYAAEDFDAISQVACPSAGACQQFGTAGTMQAMAEALGLALPGTAVVPVANTQIQRAARAAGQQVCRLAAEGISAGDILTRKAFENAITVHAAIGGSANAIMHLLAAAHEAGVDLTLEDFDRIHRQTPYLTNTLSTGKYPTEYFWYAGGIPALMQEIRDLLHGDALTATGKTLGENLDLWEKQSHTRWRSGFLMNAGLKPRDIILSRDRAITADGGIAVLKGNLAPDGALVKHSAITKKMLSMTGRVHVFSNEDDAIASFTAGKIQAGEIVAVMWQGPCANGMPELFRLSDLVANDDSHLVAVITDGRFSGCTRGPAIGYVCPEAAAGGPIGLLSDGDLVNIDIPNRRLTLVEGIFQGQVLPGDMLLKQRRHNGQKWNVPEAGKTGALAIYKTLVQQALNGGNMAVPSQVEFKEE